MSRFFMKVKGRSLLGQKPPPLKDCSLPKVKMSFYAPQREDYLGSMGFIRVENKVVATDHKFGATMYDPDMHAVRSLPSFTKRKNFPTSLAVGENLMYALDRYGSRSFEALVYADPDDPEGPHHQQGDWDWHALPPMPPLPSRDDGGVEFLGPRWVEPGDRDNGSCAYSFDTQKRVWSSKPAAWALPFRGLAECIPKLHKKLWFGIASRDHGHVFCAADLTAAGSLQEASRPPVPRIVFDDMAGSRWPKDEGWRLEGAHAVHLGSGKFCIARFFDRFNSHYDEHTRSCHELHETCAVFAGVQVFSLDGKLHVVKHNSERYMPLISNKHWVL